MKLKVKRYQISNYFVTACMHLKQTEINLIRFEQINISFPSITKLWFTKTRIRLKSFTCPYSTRPIYIMQKLFQIPKARGLIFCGI